ncbi:MAG: DUF4136 domain-containing protein [Acidiferrobacterales bacterium]
MKMNLKLGLLLALFLFATVAQARVKVDFDANADFTQYKTYAWEKGTPAADPIAQRRIERAVAEQLEAKGLRETTGTPDLYVTTHAAVKEKKAYSYVNLGYSDPFMEKEMVETIARGTLQVDLLDRKSKRVVWRAEATKTLSDNPERNARLVKKVTAQMFKRFPPRQ